MNDKNSIDYINTHLITINEMAKALKLSRSAIYNYRTKRKGISMDQLFKISSYLKNKTAKFDAYLKERVKEGMK